MTLIPQIRSLSLLALCLSLFVAGTARAEDAVEKPLSTLVKSVRYSRDAKALKQLDADAEGKLLLGDDWAKGTAAQRAEFTSLFQQLFAAIAFPKLRESLQYLGTTVYETPALSGDTASVVSTLVIDHPLKKQELRVKYDLHKSGGAWKVVDVTVLGVGGNSMLTDIRNEQIVPIMQQGGWPHLLDLMRQRLAQINKK